LAKKNPVAGTGFQKADVSAKDQLDTVFGVTGVTRPDWLENQAATSF
jgi:hypothetical protein